MSLGEGREGQGKWAVKGRLGKAWAHYQMEQEHSVAKNTKDQGTRCFFFASDFIGNPCLQELQVKVHSKEDFSLWDEDQLGNASISPFCRQLI